MDDRDLNLAAQQARRSNCPQCLRLIAEIRRRQGIVDSATASLRDVNTFLDLTDSLGPDGLLRVDRPG